MLLWTTEEAEPPTEIVHRCYNVIIKVQTNERRVSCGPYDDDDGGKKKWCKIATDVLRKKIQSANIFLDLGILNSLKKSSKYQNYLELRIFTK